MDLPVFIRFSLSLAIPKDCKHLIFLDISQQNIQDKPICNSFLSNIISHKHVHSLVETYSFVYKFLLFLHYFLDLIHLYIPYI